MTGRNVGKSRQSIRKKINTDHMMVNLIRTIYNSSNKPTCKHLIWSGTVFHTRYKREIHVVAVKEICGKTWDGIAITGFP